jgi:hypothetical protein
MGALTPGDTTISGGSVLWYNKFIGSGKIILKFGCLRLSEL